jgi:hypothetical protein
MPRARLIVVALLVGLALARPAAAAPNEGSRSELVKPVPLNVPKVPYPDGGHGNAEVILVLIVDVDGAVRSAEVESGAEPFASAARQASAAWRFVPGKQADHPVAAKIRFQVEFTAEPAAAPPGEPAAPGMATGQSASPPSGETGAPPKPSPEAPPAGEPPATREHPGALEVTIEGVRAESQPSVSSLKRAEVRQLPGAFGDPFRAIEVLPGVTPMVSALPFFYLRGAPPGNIGYFLDGIRVPYLFHAAAGPSVINPALVERVDLYAGGYPARFGRYAGGIVSAETTAPTPEWHGEGVLRILDAGALVEGGSNDAGVTALLGGRISYTAALLSLISPTIDLGYRDYQARFTYDVTPRDRLTLFSFGSYDYLASTSEATGQTINTVLFGSEFYRVDARYDSRLVGGGNVRADLIWGYDQTRVLGTRNSRDMLLGTKVELARPLSHDVTLRGGFDMQLDSYTAAPRQYADPEDPATERFNSLFPPRTDTSISAWTDLVLAVSPKLEVVPGVRVDTYISQGEGAVAVDPRLSVVAHVDPKVRILHAVGIANQPPSFIVPVPGLAVATLAGGLQRSLQASSGLEVDLPLRITASATGFAALQMNMTDSIGTRQRPLEGETVPRALGSAYGLEIYVRRALTERLGGFVSYTLSRSTRSVGSEHFFAAFDRPHVLHTAIGYDLGRGWRSGLRFSLYSGAPHAPEGATGGDETGDQTRDPPYYRVDFRVEKRWTLMDTAWLSLVVEMLNATLTKETIGGQQIGPILVPSLGLEGGF